MSQLKNVLIIEDEKKLRDRYQQELVGKVNVFFAGNLKTAEEMVRNRIWDMISYDLYLIHEEDNFEGHDTIDLITETKASGFNGDMIAASNDEANRKEQIKAGCSVMVEDKKKLVDLILSLILKNKLPLEENGKYITVGGNTVYMRGCVDMMFDFSYQIITILGISVNDYFNDQDNILNSNHILSGLTDDIIFPGGYWHQESGKCLNLNTGGVAGNGEKLKNLISRFDIKAN